MYENGDDLDLPGFLGPRISWEWPSIGLMDCCFRGRFCRILFCCSGSCCLNVSGVRWPDAALAGDGRALGLDAVTPDLVQQRQCALRRQRMATGAHAFAQEAMQDQSEIAVMRQLMEPDVETFLVGNLAAKPIGIAVTTARAPCERRTIGQIAPPFCARILGKFERLDQPQTIVHDALR